MRLGLGLQCRLLVALGPLMALLLGRSGLLCTAGEFFAPFLWSVLSIVPLILAAMVALPHYTSRSRMRLLGWAGKLMGTVWHLLAALANFGDRWSHGSLICTPAAMLFSLIAVLMYFAPRGCSPGARHGPLLLFPY